MMIVRFRNGEDHDEMLGKVKKMKKFAEELEDCLMEAVDEPEYRTSYHKDYEEYNEDRRGRYGYAYPRR